MTASCTGRCTAATLKTLCLDSQLVMEQTMYECLLCAGCMSHSSHSTADNTHVHIIADNTHVHIIHETVALSTAQVKFCTARHSQQ